MAHVLRSAVIAASAAEVWQKIGDFHGLHNWHPAVAASGRETGENGAERRRLTLADGAEIIEDFLGYDGMSYGYAIVESPFPVADYRSVISVVEIAGKSVVVWSAVFTPTSDDAEAVMGGVYEAGLDAAVNAV